jgi:hypothetical protein
LSSLLPDASSYMQEWTKKRTADILAHNYGWHSLIGGSKIQIRVRSPLRDEGDHGGETGEEVMPVDDDTFDSLWQQSLRVRAVDRACGGGGAAGRGGGAAGGGGGATEAEGGGGGAERGGAAGGGGGATEADREYDQLAREEWLKILVGGGKRGVRDGGLSSALFKEINRHQDERKAPHLTPTQEHSANALLRKKIRGSGKRTYVRVERGGGGGET